MRTIVLLVGVFLFSSTGDAQYYNLSNDAGNSSRPQVVADEYGNVHVVWVDNTAGKSEIYYSVYGSMSPERTVIRPGSISGLSDSCSHPRMAVDSAGNTVYVTWEDFLSSGKSVIEAVVFRNPLLYVNAVTNEYMLSAGIDSACYRPDIAIMNGVPFVCFVSNDGNDQNPYNGKLYFTRFDTSTAKWSSPIVVDDTVAMDSFGHEHFWGRVSPAFNGTVFYENSHGMNAFKNLTVIGPLQNRIVSDAFLHYMQGMDVAYRKTPGGDRAYVLYHGDGTTCNCDEPVQFYEFDGSEWTTPTIIAGSSNETISWGGFSIAAVSDSDIVAVCEKDQWTSAGTTDTLQTSVFDGTSWKVSGNLPETGGYSQPSVSVGYNANLWFAFCGPSTSGGGEVFLYGDPLTSVHSSTGSAYPTGFCLHQNYPNPFNPTTTISYQIPTNSVVTLKVYDVLGREIATLVNRRENPGSYSVRFDGANLPSGVYFYRLDAGTYHEAKRFLLLK